MQTYNHKHFYVIIFGAGEYSNFEYFQNKSDALLYKRGYEDAADNFGGYPSVYLYPDEQDSMSEETEYKKALKAIGKE